LIVSILAYSHIVLCPKILPKKCKKPTYSLLVKEKRERPFINITDNILDQTKEKERKEGEKINFAFHFFKKGGEK
jgi:hypothetical protein